MQYGIGFIPKEAVWNEDRQGFDFESVELIEISLVKDPPNPHAVIAREVPWRDRLVVGLRNLDLVLLALASLFAGGAVAFAIQWLWP